MNIKKRKIELPNKDTMLFIAKSIFDLKISSNLPKNKIYEKVLAYYKTEANLYTLIEVLSHDAYTKLKKIIENALKYIDIIHIIMYNYK